MPERHPNERRLALITGASAGIGRELARVFAREGYDLALVARRAPRVEELANELAAAHGIRAFPLPFDLAQPGGIAALREKLKEQGVRVTDLVNNAGFGAYGEFASLDRARQLEMVTLNIAALTELTHLFIPELRAARPGRILNVASTAAFLPGPLMSVYYASKAYVLSLSEALARELAGAGITVTVLCPGPTTTEFGEVAGVPGSRLLPIVSMSAERVARAGFRGMVRGRAIVIPGAANWISVQLIRFSPRALIRKVSHALNAGMKGRLPAGNSPAENSPAGNSPAENLSSKGNP